MDLGRERDVECQPQVSRRRADPTDQGSADNHYRVSPGDAKTDDYHWRNGVGSAGSRPKTPSMPGDRDGSVHNFGTDEGALDPQEQAGEQALIAVDTGTGTAEEAADWVGSCKWSGRRRMRSTLGGRAGAAAREDGPCRFQQHYC